MDVEAACEKAQAYVAAHGDDVQRCTALAILGRGSGSDLLASLDVDVEDVHALRVALGRADGMRALSAPVVRNWCGALASRQSPDGGWLSSHALDDRLFETGMIGGHLAKTRFVRPETLGGACEFLATHWSPDRVQGGSWHAIAAYAHLFANADHELADAILQWCGRELGKGFVSRQFDPVETARVFVLCDAHGIPGAELAPDELLIALLSEQGLDGSFCREGGPDVGATLDGLLALRRLAGGGCP